MLKTKIIHILFAVLLSTAVIYAQKEKTSENTPKLKKALKNDPQVDKNKDGILTTSEAREFKQKEKNKSSAKEQSEAGKIKMSENGVLNVQYGNDEAEFFFYGEKRHL